MRPLKKLGQKALEKLIAQHVPRDVFMALEDAAVDGDKKGRSQAASFARGHKRTAAGHLKHLHSNETFYEALRAHDANPSPLRGTSLVVGRLGIFNVAAQRAGPQVDDVPAQLEPGEAGLAERPDRTQVRSERYVRGAAQRR